MVQCATNILTLMTMLLHSFLGCCWHHPHDCSTDGCAANHGSNTDEQTDELAPQQSCRHSHGHACQNTSSTPALDEAQTSLECHAAHENQPAHEEQPAPCREECQADHCLYVLPSEVKVQGLDQPSILYVLGGIENEVATGATKMGFLGDPAPLAFHHGEPHSLMQVWRL